MQPVRDALRAGLHFQNLTIPPFGQGVQTFGQSLAVTCPGQQLGAGRLQPCLRLGARQARGVLPLARLRLPLLHLTALLINFGLALRRTAPGLQRRRQNPGPQQGQRQQCGGQHQQTALAPAALLPKCAQGVHGRPPWLRRHWPPSLCNW